MNRRHWLCLGAGAPLTLAAQTRLPDQSSAEGTSASPEKLLLKDYRPRSIYKVPETGIQRAKFPILDAHSHGPRPASAEQVKDWIQLMDQAGVDRTVVFLSSNPERFAAQRALYTPYDRRFDLWCNLNFTGCDQPGFGPQAIESLESCRKLGAVGVGEVSDKGWGFGRFVRRGEAAPATAGPHADDPRLDPLWRRCGELGLPVNIHVSDPIWSYQPMDGTNDGLMNAFTWRIDDKQPGILGHDGLIRSLDAVAQRHPRTTFIACHLANLEYDLARLGQIFDHNPNLFADISARFAETAPIPRAMNKFLSHYPDRVLYGTDMGYSQPMFSATFRILESEDEHFYDQDENFNFDYHWPLYGFGLPDKLLKGIYKDNAELAYRQAQAHATS
ncbi:MAG: amidohydrolase family protein [Bryobacteraceae bacterium]